MDIEKYIVPIFMFAIPAIYSLWYFIKTKDDSFKKSINPTSLATVIITLIIAAFVYGIVIKICKDEKVADVILRFSLGVYVSAFFALCYSITTEKSHNIRFNNTISSLSSSIDGVGNELEKLRENQPKIYDRNDAKKPNVLLFKKLSTEILDGETLIYEGENAVNASMCLQAINDLATKKNLDKTIDVKMILKQPRPISAKSNGITPIPPKNEQNVIDLFTTLFIIYNLKNSTNLSFQITVYKNTYREQSKSPYCQFVNLTENSLFFSPHKKTDKGGFPYTFNFKKTMSDDCFYKQFKNYMNAHIVEDFSDNTTRDFNNVDDFISLFSFFEFASFAKNNYFEGKFNNYHHSNYADYEIDQITNYFIERIKQRKEIYKDCTKVLFEIS